jgi:hypothetical protein
MGDHNVADALKGLQGIDLEAAVKHIQANPALASRVSELARRLPGSLAAGNFNCVCAPERKAGADVVNPA